MDYKALGNRIKEERISEGLTQEQLAEKTNVSRLYISFIEKGDRKVSMIVLEKISECLDTSIDYLIKGNNYAHKEIVHEFGKLISTCTNQDAKKILDIVKSALPLTESQQ